MSRRRALGANPRRQASRENRNRRRRRNQTGLPPGSVKGYAEQETLNQRARQVEEYARTFEQQSAQVAQEIGQARQTYQQRLEYIGRVMADLYPKELNWEAEYSADPKAAHDKEKVYQHVRGRMTSIAQEMQREQAEAQAQSKPRRKRRPAGGGLRRMGQTGVQTKNRNHRHRDAEQRIFSHAQGRHGSLRLQRTGNRDRLRSPNAARPPGRQRIPTHDG